MTKATHQLSLEIIRSRIKTWSVFSTSLGINLSVFLNYPQEYSSNKTYLLTIVAQQQHSSHEQLGHSFADELFLHSSGRQPQSAHFI